MKLPEGNESHQAKYVWRWMKERYKGQSPDDPPPRGAEEVTAVFSSRGEHKRAPTHEVKREQAPRKET